MYHKRPSQATRRFFTGSGGLLGVAVAVVVCRFSINGVAPVIVPSSVVLALAVSVAIGIVFGSFPAHRAAGLRPVVALRHE